MNDDLVIKVENVHKSFRLPHEKQTSIKGLFVNALKKRHSYETQKVLKNVSFEVRKGEFFGIVGRNGSGKSTLLKLLAGIYSPDKGHINIKGRLTPFIELGVGFNPELTGRENVYLNGALLGFSRKDMSAKYNEIVEFAELEKFMDQKLKNYSSGMQVRLAFSIAIQAKSDILILDEVLAVGDEAFQQKCIGVFEDYKAAGQTIVLVTHDMSVVERFCSKALMIKDGRIVKIGEPGKVAREYSQENKNAIDSGKPDNYDAQKDINIKILNNKTKQQKKRFTQGDKIIIRLSWENPRVENVGVALIKRSGEYIFGPNTYQDNYRLNKDRKTIDYILNLDIMPGEYYLKTGLFGESDNDIISFLDEGPSFIVEPKETKKSKWGGLTKLNYMWRDPDVKL